MLVIVGLTLLLACCLSKGGKVVEGFNQEECRILHLTEIMNWYTTNIGEGKFLNTDDEGNITVNIIIQNFVI